MSKLTHFDNDGNPNMVDVSSKDISIRNAKASGFVYMEEQRTGATRPWTLGACIVGLSLLSLFEVM